MGAGMGYVTIRSILVAAFVLRAGLAFGVQIWLDRQPGRTFVVAGDADGYWELGLRIARGDDYALHSPPRYVMRMPGYPLFLAGIISICGESLLAVRMVSAVVGTCAVWLVYLLGKELLSPRVALLGAGIQAISPLATGFSVLVLSETLFAAGLTLSLWLAARWLKSDGAAASCGTKLFPAVLTGVGVAIATYIRPSWLPALVVFAVAGVLRFGLRRAIVPSIACLAAGFLALLPWAARNHHVTGHWVWTTLWMGPSLYDGLNPDADGGSEMSFFDRDAVMTRRGMSEYEMNRWYRDRAIEFARNQPGKALQLIGRHAARYWSPVPNAEQFRSWPLAAAVAVFTVPLLLLGVVGTVSLRTKSDRVLLIAGPILAFGLLHLIFVGSLRYRLPAEYPFALAAAQGLVQCCARKFGTPQEGAR